MLRAIELARQTSLIDKAGGPFGCVIAKDGEIIAEGANTVLADNDPTSHGEMNAIRNACKELGTHDLSGCTLYTTSEPCPMCYGAIWWARVQKIYYASTIHDAKEFGNFDDLALSEAIKSAINERPIMSEEILRSEMLQLWDEFNNALHY
ncbi:MAG TPA: nucleoside deaminase [Phycisphaerales bacterium]|nr:nucleoside deaminase [Phycisphaerales bacterium]